MKFDQQHKCWILLLSLSLAIIVIFKTVPIASDEIQSLRRSNSSKSESMTLTTRVSNNLIYWTPHKTGSTSMRIWLKQVSAKTGLNVKHFGYYPYSAITTWHERAGTRKCSVLVGHIRTKEKRDHEGSLGVVISTSRNPMDTFASKYFHRTGQGKGDIPFMNDKSSRQSRYWFFYFNDIDVCEQLRYYDGKEGCVMETIRERARMIAERIDCVVDTDDPQEDMGGICRMMKLEECPKFLKANNGNSKEYENLFQNKHLVDGMERVVRVGNILREELLKRRCRFLVKGDELSKSGVPLPQWPYKGCKEVEL